jgi:hypothetical protein
MQAVVAAEHTQVLRDLVDQAVGEMQERKAATQALVQLLILVVVVVVLEALVVHLVQVVMADQV